MNMLLLDPEFYQYLAIYLFQTYYYPTNTIPMNPQLLFTLILILLGLLPMSLPLIHYAFKLRGFVKYSEMWQPWKKLALGWLLLIIGALSGVFAFSYIVFSGMINKPYISIIFLMTILSPMVICMIITIILTFLGIKEFYNNAKKVLEE